ncbi:hypothetical protein LCGC14_0467190 [marine sediment metagenome]|uniref:Uncharacterized protein n=1 Tax=marine sediment metagenome TaxID=412755 RepID=A0A0F9V044_9ZZZZ
MSLYNETDPVPKDLDLSTPTEGASPPAEINNAIREVKRVLKVENAVITTTGNLQLSEQHSTVLINGAHTITLPTIANVSSSTFTKRYRLINISSSTGVLKTKAGAETLNGSDYSSTGLNLAVQYAEYLVYGNGTVWYMETVVTTDTISELTAAAGVTIDSCTIKDGGVEAVTDQGGGANLLLKVIEIGDWDMDAASSHNVAHGIGASYKNIRSISGIIRDDDDTNYYKLELIQLDGVPQGGVSLIGSVNIQLERFATGTFDAAAFDDFGGVQGNRGWVTIGYIE